MQICRACPIIVASFIVPVVSDNIFLGILLSNRNLSKTISHIGQFTFNIHVFYIENIYIILLFLSCISCLKSTIGIAYQHTITTAQWILFLSWKNMVVGMIYNSEPNSLYMSCNSIFCFLIHSMIESNKLIWKNLFGNSNTIFIFNYAINVTLREIIMSHQLITSQINH